MVGRHLQVPALLTEVDRMKFRLSPHRSAGYHGYRACWNREVGPVGVSDAEMLTAVKDLLHGKDLCESASAAALAWIRRHLLTSCGFDAGGDREIWDMAFI